MEPFRWQCELCNELTEGIKFGVGGRAACGKCYGARDLQKVAEIAAKLRESSLLAPLDRPASNECARCGLSMCTCTADATRLERELAEAQEDARGLREQLGRMNLQLAEATRGTAKHPPLTCPGCYALEKAEQAAADFQGIYDWRPETHEAELLLKGAGFPIVEEGAKVGRSIVAQVTAALTEIDRLKREPAPERPTKQRRFRLVPVDRRNDKPGRPYEFEVEPGKRVYVTVYRNGGPRGAEGYGADNRIGDNVVALYSSEGDEWEAYELLPAEALDVVIARG